MTKKRVNVTISEEVHREAKRLRLNISGVTERALRIYVTSLQSSQENLLNRPEIDTQTQRESPLEIDQEDDQTNKSVDQILSEYNQFAETALNRSESTLNQHRRYIGRLLRRAEIPPSEIEEEDIMSYIESEKPMSESKRKNILSALRIFFREYVEIDVADRFTIPTMSPNPTKVPTKDELQTFYDAIENPKYRAIFLMYASSGLRSAELVGLSIDDIDEDDRMLLPKKESEVKKTWVSFYNEEAADAFEGLNPDRNSSDGRLFQVSKATVNTTFRRISEKSGVKITPQLLRRWFASEMASLGVDSSYIDAFCGRTPDSVLEKHYLDYSPRKLKQIYTDAGLKVLD